MRSRQTRFDSAFGAQALCVSPAVAVLQVRPVGGLIESDERADAVARTVTPVPADVRTARGEVLIIREFAVSLSVTREKRLPTEHLRIEHQ